MQELSLDFRQQADHVETKNQSKDQSLKNKH
jgi:hypothetical protein